MQPRMPQLCKWLHLTLVAFMSEMATYCRTSATETVIDGVEGGEGVGMKEGLSGLTEWQLLKWAAVEMKRRPVGISSRGTGQPVWKIPSHHFSIVSLIHKNRIFVHYLCHCCITQFKQRRTTWDVQYTSDNRGAGLPSSSILCLMASFQKDRQCDGDLGCSSTIPEGQTSWTEGDRGDRKREVMMAGDEGMSDN